MNLDSVDRAFMTPAATRDKSRSDDAPTVIGF